MGAFIVLEGGDGAGKTTHAALLAGRMRRRGRTVLVAREPGGTPLGRALRGWLKGGRPTTPLAELLLFSAARAEIVHRVILPALRTGATVVCDRFAASTVAYQGYGRGLDLDLIHTLNLQASQGLRPDLTVLLDVPAEAGLARKEPGSRDRFESEVVEFHRRVRSGYLSLASSARGDWAVLDGTGSKADVASLVWKTVQPFLDTSRKG
ncbi:MAG: dTMP kinase [Dehalococcoidia bacterium]|nr:dTMP kinase [Dehalococcoidia bacterium]